MDLKDKKCIPCSTFVTPLPIEEKKRLLGLLGPEWELTHDDSRLRRNFKFKNFKRALEFANEVGRLAEEEKHHPEIYLGWGHCDIEIWTHTNKNLVENDFRNNQIGESFNTNRIYSPFGENTIGIEFYDNTIYSGLYQNEIGNYFRGNAIGDSGNRTNFSFEKNVIADAFEYNAIRQSFGDNKIGNSFANNIANGNFAGNVIGYDFSQNGNIGYDFSDNHIGNNFDSNEMIGDYFRSNQIGNGFESNSISYDFQGNQIGNNFENNTLGNTDYFNWANTSIENLDSRDYDNFQNALYGNGEAEQAVIGNVILGKELIMRDTANNEYHKVKFTQWTQGGNGGGFSYERTKVYPEGEATVYFTKRNYEDVVDVIVPGSLEITRGNGGAIYNAAEEVGWNPNVSPLGTLWNSIYTQDGESGSNFRENTIAGEFKGNLIYKEFLGNDVNFYVGSNQFFGPVYGNQIGTYTFGNDFLGEVGNNKWIGEFTSNEIGLSFSGNTFGSGIFSNTLADDFRNNQIGNEFNNNTISNDFQHNQIGNRFEDNSIGEGFGFGASVSQGNRIGNYFVNNNIGEYFYNNSIPDNFQNNTIGNYFQWNVINTNIASIDFTPNYGNITGFTYTATGTTATDDTYTALTGTTNGDGVNATFDVGVSGGAVIGVTGNTGGKLYAVGNTITILGTEIGGTNVDDDVVITVTGVSPNPSVYEPYTCQIFERQGGVKRLSYYDQDDILTIKSPNEVEPE